jgi:ribose-phosphate pyrophosphokinase
MTVTLLSTVSGRPFADRLAAHLGIPVGVVEREEFPDGERYLRLGLVDRFDLVKRQVVLVAPTADANSLDEVYRLGCSVVKYAAHSLIVVMPYFGCSTMERAVRPGEVVTAKILARQLSGIPRASRGNVFLLMDLHAAGIVHYFENDAIALELYAEAKLLPAIERLGLSNLVLASTDMGRAKWVEKFANRLQTPVALIHKRRLSGSATRVAAVVGDVAGRDVVIYDDMIRSGSSLCQAADAYLQAGAASVHAVTTHLVIPGDAIARLEAFPLGHIVGTDTHPNHLLVQGRPRFEVVSVADLFAEVVARLVG